MENLEKIVSENMTALRKREGLTQLELAEKLHYSDKSISKWERGDALPDLKVLTAMAALYGVTLDFFTTENAMDDPEKFAVPKSQLGYQVGVASLGVCLVWLIATMVYTYQAILTGTYHWQVFIWALPISFLVLHYFSRKWFNGRGQVVYSSLLSWTLLTAVYLEWFTFNMWMLYIVGIPAQIAIILMAQIKKAK